MAIQSSRAELRHRSGAQSLALVGRTAKKGGDGVQRERSRKVGTGMTVATVP